MLRYSLILFLLTSLNCIGQPNLLNAKKPIEIGLKTANQIKYDNTKPLDYGYIDDRDVMFGKRIWEFIDIEQRINFPLYYPTKPLMDRKPLFEVLREYVQSGEKNKINIKDFCFQDDYFSIPLDASEAESKFNDFRLTKEGDENVNKNFNPTKIDPATDAAGFRKLCLKLIEDKKLKEGPDYKTAELNAVDVKGYKIQGYWYFDKRLSELKYRLIAIAPVASSAKSIVDATMGQQEIEDEYTQIVANQGTLLTPQQEEEKKAKLKIYEEMSAPDVLFWVYYPAIRNILKLHPTFNDRNSSKPINFDDLLLSRHFNAVIYKEENVQGDRLIEKYKANNAMDQLLEAERVKDKIRDFEHDLWNY
jgi:gliding motility associated protien GldN